MYLVRPVHPILQFIFREQGWKIASLVVIVPVFIILVFFFKLHLPFNSVIQIVLFIISVFFGAVIYSLWDMIIGMTAFFVQNMMPINRLNRIFYALMSGQIIPVSLMPVGVLKITNLLFFRYTFAFPSEILFVPEQLNIVSLFLGQMIWVVIMIFLFNLVFKMGVRRYEAYGA